MDPIRDTGPVTETYGFAGGGWWRDRWNLEVKEKMMISLECWTETKASTDFCERSTRFYLAYI